MSSSTIIHPLFEECRNYTLDPYWKDKFSDFASNRFPSGIRYDPSNRNLILKLDGKKTEVIGLSDEDPELTFRIVMKILKGKLNMHSTRDIKFLQDEMEENSKSGVCDLDCEWKKIKPRHLKDQLLMDYVAKLKIDYELSPLEVTNLRSVIYLGFQFKALSQEDVIFENGIVKGINGLKFAPKTRKFTVPMYQNAPKGTSKAPIPDKFYSTLKKFLRDDATRSAKFRN